MKLPNWFKISWWVVLSIALGLLLSRRFGAISDGAATPVDAFLFLIWVALLLLPLFKEFEFFGVKLKAELDSFKSEVKDHISSLRSEIHSTIGISSQFNPSINLGPPPDAQLPQIEQRFRTILEDTMRAQGIQRDDDLQADIAIPDSVSYLFRVRYLIESELRRIYDQRFLHDAPKRPTPVVQLVQILKEAELIEPRLANIIREVYAISSPAIHGQGVTEQKLAFVRDIAPNLITTLKAL